MSETPDHPGDMNASDDHADQGWLVERVTSAWRPLDRYGNRVSHPAWHDMTAEDRERAFLATVLLRHAEARLDPEGLSSTARCVCTRLGLI